MRAAKGKNDLREIRRLETKIQAIQDGYKRMHIWPLIEAGEFSAISNGQVTAEDLALADGKWSNWAEQKLAELPGGLGTAARYGLITKDTSLYQGLARSVQYGDFVAKAIQYDYLTKTKKMPKEEALMTVSRSFINYNRLPGRFRGALESNGLLWFWNFKLRIMREAMYLLRHNPLKALLILSVPRMPMIGDLGTPIGDGAIGKRFGKAKRSESA